jgi:murein DD-endopeptidase MepM/ murein hydrolase activator NlpD
MLSVLRSSIALHWPRFQWQAVLIGVLATLAISQVLMAWQGRTQQHMRSLSTLSAESLLPVHSHGERLAIEEKPFVATTEVFGASLATSSPYFRVLTRLYGMPGSNEPMPVDEAAAFHDMEPGLPVAMARITSNFGERANPFGKGHAFHRGIDIAAPVGTPVLAVAEGTIVTARHHATYGNYVVIDHHNGYHTLYAHNSALLVKPGQRVKAGQDIAKVGSTGRSTGPHLHFEIHRDGAQVDPYPYLAAL